MAILWPAGLPYAPERDQYALPQRGQAPVASEMQNGKVRQRPRSTLVVSTMNWGRLFSAADLAAFRTFTRTTLGQACSRFQMPVWDPPSQSYVARTVLIVGGLSGIAEKDMASFTLVTMTLAVEGL